MFALRFIKDGVIIGDHSFTIFVVVLVLDLLMDVLVEG
jgi:hypothetical protein